MPLVRAVANRVVAGFLVVMGVLMIVLAAGLWQQRETASDAEHRSDQFTSCTAQWQADFLNAYRARSDASYVVNQALDKLIRAVASRDEHAFRKALHHYVTVRDRQNEQRANHPLPPLPAVRCGQ